LHGWFPDTLAKDTELPFSCPVFLRLLHACRRLTPARCEELSQRAVASTHVPSAPAFLQLKGAEAAAAKQWERHKDRDASPAFLRLRTAPAATRTRLANTLREYLGAMTRARSRDLPWVSVAIKEVVTGHETPWKSLQETSVRCLAGLRRRAELADARSIRFPAEADREKLLQDARDLLAHLNAGGRLGWWRLRPKVVKRTLYLVREVPVNGRPCDSPQPLRELIEQLEVDKQLDNLWSQWLHRTERPKASRLHQVTTLEEHLEALTQVLELQKPLEVAKGVASEIAGFPEPTWFNNGVIGGLLADLEAADADDRLVGARARFESHIAALHAVASHPHAHPVNASLLRALRERDVEAYAVALHELEQLEADLALRSDRDGLLGKLKGVAPHLAASILESPNEPKWDERLAAIEEAWAWARADAWLRDFHRRDDGKALDDELQRIEKTLRGKLADLAAAKAWRECFRRMKEEHRQYLLAWSKEIKLIGKGTGKYAGHHRRVAQKYMEQCREAIPAWVMPFYRIAETVLPRPNAFDVVIIDEASQSGPEALLLQYLGKQLLVVGDDQQISPDFVGYDQTKVQALIDQYLHDFEFKNNFGIGRSLFDHAAQLYRSRIVLREHFRCMPEIIRFSNDLCYWATPLIPLRQYPPQRLEPLVVRDVPQGFREGGPGVAINRPEAEALVEDVVSCCSHAAYAGKTMGVISLQGEYQARLIEQLLRERLDESEIERRNIVCGDAYAFQGDERDVIFLSMVAATNAPIGALTKEADKRRFNVAASRAKDHVRLFHTATLNDLNPEDMRYKLLAYYTNPAAPVFTGPDWDRCESNFEREAGQRIHARGYRVLVQYEPLGAGGKRIDLVIEGTKTRLAVECDGDYWHGPDKYEEDMRRQRQLERAGWVFWRIRQSEFERDPEKALDPLWKLLGEMEIFPVGQHAPSSEAAVSGPPRSDMATRKHPYEDSPLVARPTVQETVSAGVMGGPGENGTMTEERRAPARTVVGSIEAVSQEKVREALYACLPAKGRIGREVLLRLATQRLGFSKLGSRVRSRLNRAIGAEKRAGRLETDWATVWRAEGQQAGDVSEPASVQNSPQFSPPQIPALDQAQVSKAILDIVQGHLFGVSREKIPAAVSERLGLQKIDSETLHIAERAIIDLADKGFLKLKAGRVYPA
jgi:very-short-patch-repair endonuclease